MQSVYDRLKTLVSQIYFAIASNHEIQNYWDYPSHQQTFHATVRRIKPCIPI